jgi:hypothetical protein
MLKSTLIFIIVFSACCFAQEEENFRGKIKYSRFSAGITVSPDICYRTLKNTNGSSINEFIIDMRDEREIPIVGYSAGINICYNITPSIGIETGIALANRGYKTEKTDLNFGDQIDPRYGFTYTNTGSGGPTGQFIYDYYYFDIPLKVNFKVGKGRTYFISSLGFALNILSKATVTSVVDGNNGSSITESYTSQFNYEKIGVSAIASAGAGYKLNSRITFRAEPTFRYGLTDIIDAPITANLWSGGFSISCFYILSRKQTPG